MWLPETNFVIWGLANKRHSHRYIHQGFYQSLTNMGFPVIWVSDSKKNQNLITKNSVVIACGVAAINLPLNTSARYVLHNFDNNISKDLNHINLQVLTNQSTGIKIDESSAMWDKLGNTLYQPWGLPESPHLWLEPPKFRCSRENWVGAVWNNQANQGNLLEIAEYVRALNTQKIHFKRFGGTRSLTKKGLSSERSFQLVNKSAIGAAIIGKWQKEHSYIPCRAFKNVAAGAIPISNSNLQHIFGESYLYIDNLSELVEYSLGMGHNEIFERSYSCKKALKHYSYERAIDRILECLIEK